MNGTNTREDIENFLHEQFTDIIEGEGEGTGPVDRVAVMHQSAAGVDTLVHEFVGSRNPPQWGKPNEMAELIDGGVARHARGIVGGGAQQYAVTAIRRGKATRTLPFIRVGATQIGGMAGGSFATEPANATGAMSQGMRLLEIHAQGNFQLTQSLVSAQAAQMDKMATQLDKSEARADARAQALFTLLIEWHKQMQAAQWRMLMMEGVKKAMPMLPAILGTATGTDAPQLTEPSFFDAMVESVPPEQLKMMIASLPQPAGAVAADMLVKAQRRKAARDAEGGGSGNLSNFERALADASGEAYRALEGHKEGKANGGYATGDADPAQRIVNATKATNGHAANGHAADGAAKGHSDAAKTEPAPPPVADGEKGEVLDAILASTSADQIKMLGQAGVIPEALVEKILRIKGAL